MIDLDKLIDGVIRVSSFIAARVVFAGFIAYVFSMGVDSSRIYLNLGDLLDLIPSIFDEYRDVLSSLDLAGASFFVAIFVSVSVSHILFELSVQVGRLLPFELRFQSIEDVEAAKLYQMLRALQNLGSLTAEKAEALTSSVQNVHAVVLARRDAHFVSVLTAYRISRVCVLVIIFAAFMYRGADAIDDDELSMLSWLAIISFLSSLGLYFYLLSYAQTSFLRLEELINSKVRNMLGTSLSDSEIPPIIEAHQESVPFRSKCFIFERDLWKGQNYLSVENQTESRAEGALT